jgi:hypothetical protein
VRRALYVLLACAGLAWFSREGWSTTRSAVIYLAVLAVGVWAWPARRRGRTRSGGYTADRRRRRGGFVYEAYRGWPMFGLRRPLYIGKTCRPGDRMRAHERSSRWYPQARYIVMRRHRTDSGMSSAEKRRIERKHPRDNVTYNRRVKGR